MKKSVFIVAITLLVGANISVAQVQIYNPQADAIADLDSALKIAKKENKNVLVQIGGNWCPWCAKMHNLFETDSSIVNILHENYITIRVNYSKENKNLELLGKLENPQRFGFPVLVVINSNGQRIHTQDSGLLESGNGYDTRKVVGFLKNWTATAVNQ
ncbi:MAG: thioredoxin family protein [Bacteroidales bacterium]